MKKLVLLMLIIALFVPAYVFAAEKYEAIDVKNGGSIKGKIKASGAVQDPAVEINKDQDYCGKSQPSHTYVISPNMEVKNVLVYIEDITKGKAAPKTDLTLDNKKCAFEPLVGVAYVGQKYIIKNSDPIFHNTSLGVILGEGKRRTVYNLALPNKDQTIEKQVKVAGMQSVKCDAHSWMRAYIYASSGPYAVITDDKGSFEIKDVPPGKYKVKIWHEGFGETTKEVEVKSGSAAELDHTFSKK
jgi:hypothetical protein